MHVPREPQLASALAAEPGEIVEQGGHQRAVARVFGWQAGGVEVEQIARFRGRVRPRRGGHGEQLVLEIGLPFAQLPDMALDFGQRAAQIGCLLRGHAAVLVEIDGMVSHWRLASDAIASAKSSARIECISTEPSTPGTMIDVPTRRQAE